jgi:cysteine synthase B
MIGLTSMEAVEAMLILNRKCGVLCGPSSGANYKVAIDYLKSVDATLTERKKAVFVVCDRMEWYISYIRQHMPQLFGEQDKKNALKKFDSLSAPAAGSVKVGDFSLWQDKNPQAIIIDIRSHDSFQMVSMPKSINMPIEMFEKWIDNNNPFPADASVLLVCAIGERSRHYAAYLNSIGCKALNLDGGILAYHDICQVAA